LDIMKNLETKYFLTIRTFKMNVLVQMQKLMLKI